MGEIVLAAKVTHLPTLLMSEQEGLILDKRQPAIDGDREIAWRAKELGATTNVVFATHWAINAGFYVDDKKCDVVTICFPSSGAGRTSLIFPV